MLEPYSEYKDSGVRWLGQVPSHWRSAQVRRVATIVNGGTPTPDASNWGGGVSWATPVDLNAVDGGSLGSTIRNLTQLGLDSGSAAIPAGSVLLSTRAPIGYSALTTSSVAFNQGCKGLVPREVLDPRYLLYVVQAAKDELSYRGQGTTFLELSSGALGSTDLPIAPLEEQRAITKFLDKETAEIDAFTADQEELIGLLAERRAATISHAVTKGLDPSVPMKDSGVERLGEVPANWSVGNIRRFAQMKTGHTPSRTHEKYWEDCRIPWFTLADVWQLRQGRVLLGETKGLISELGLSNSAAELLPAGTVVLSRTASVGFSGIMPRPMATSQDFWNWVCSDLLVPKFLWYQFLMTRPHFGFLAQGSTHKTIYQSDAAALSIAVPALKEQEALVIYLDKEVAELDAAIADAREAIALSKERRAALISAAVTGKIDVRELA